MSSLQDWSSGAGQHGLALIAMAVLLMCSAVFSAAEAAFFSLGSRDRRWLRAGSFMQRRADALLDQPERLLSAVLFWNLIINVAYFALASVVSLRLEAASPHGGRGFVFSMAALLLLIIGSEMLPKSLAVLNARRWSVILAQPVALATSLVDPMMPLLRGVQRSVVRALYPGFQPERALTTTDLERAVEISTSDAQLVEQEKTALRNILLLSEIRVDEWMRPRTQYRAFKPPVSLSQLDSRGLADRYLLLTESDGDSIVAAVNLQRLIRYSPEHLEDHAEEVAVVPWCATVADALHALETTDRGVAVIVNEFGETIGILTLDDILDTIFTYHPSRSRLLMGRKPIHYLSPGKWLVAGITSLRRLERYLQRPFPPSRSVTVAGVVQELLERLAQPGDTCRWGDYELRVLEVPQRGHMLVEITQLGEEGGSP